MGLFPGTLGLSCSPARSSPGSQPRRQGLLLPRSQEASAAQGHGDEGAREFSTRPCIPPPGVSVVMRDTQSGQGDMCTVLSKLAVIRLASVMSG